MCTESDLLLKLLRSSLDGIPSDCSSCQDVNWESLFALSCRHNVAPLASAALESCDLVPFVTMLKFAALQEKAAQHYDKVRAVAAELAAAFKAQGLRTVILKGLTISRLYPIPEFRDFSDLDILALSPDSKPASDQAESIALSKGARHAKSGYHHSSFTYKGIYIEDHFDLTSTPIRHSAAAYERLLKDELLGGLETVTIDGEELFCGSPDFEALFLARHSAIHFERDCISLRHLIDWMQFLRLRGDRVDWQRICAIYKRFGLDRFVGVLDAVLQIRFSYRCPWPSLAQLSACSDDKTTNRVWNEILQGKTRKNKNTGGSSVRRLARNFALSFRHRWKHRLCSNDPLWLDMAYAVRAAAHRLIRKF